jgi:hypothetical protein
MESEFIAHHTKEDFGASVPHSLDAAKKYSDYLKSSTEHSEHSKHSKTPSEVLDACRTRLQRARGLVRPRAAGLFTGVEYSRIRDNAWYVPYLIVTTHIGIGLVELKETTR